MSIKCEDLLGLKMFADIRLVAGKTGLGRSISWPYVGTTPSVAQWVHGGELLFITGVGGIYDDSHKLLTLLHECINKRLAGLVILLGDEYIKEVPQELIELANRSAFPLFTMPWDVKLIDVTQEIVQLIMFNKFELQKSKSFLGRVLFSEFDDYANLMNLADVYDIKLLEYFCICVLNLPKDDYDALSEDSIEESVQQSLIMLCREKKLPIVSLVYGDNIVCLFSAATVNELRENQEYIEMLYHMLGQLHKQTSMYLSFGRTYNNYEHIKKSYDEANKALKLAKSIMKEKIVSYDRLGIYRLLFEIKNEKEIEAYYLNNLGKVIEYDLVNNTELLLTLKNYLLNDANLVKTSQKMFVHRNTLVYRINKIKELLGIDLEDAFIKLELLNSIIAKEYLEQ